MAKFLTKPMEKTKGKWTFEKDFFDKLSSVSNIDIGMSMPYIKVVLVDGVNEIDLNLKYFFRPTDMDKVGEGRYDDRPVASIQAVRLKTDEAGGGGQYYTNVEMSVKIHNPYRFGDFETAAIMFPGTPLKLEYGWKTASDSILAEAADSIQFQVVNYEISFDKLGQIDLTVFGKALAENFRNTYIGDEGFDIKDLGGNIQRGIKVKYEQLQKIIEHVKKLKDGSKEGSKNYDAFLNLDQVDSAKDITEGTISTNFKNYMEELRSLTPNPDVRLVGKSRREKVCYRFYDVLKSLCGTTFDAIRKMFPGSSDFFVHFGNFNGHAGEYKDKWIGNFPIPKDIFHGLVGEGKKKTGTVLTVGRLIDLLDSEFLTNEQYLLPPFGKKSKGQKEKQEYKKRTLYKKPSIKFFLTNEYAEPRKDIMAVHLYIFDQLADMPDTTEINDGLGNSPPEEKVNAAIKEQGLPILQVGHATSFLMDINLSQNVDEAMKATLINKMYQGRPESIFDPISQRLAGSDTAVRPLKLPLRGQAQVLGHTKWRPFKVFYLKSGFYFTDGAYAITAVEHEISREGFKTSINFRFF